MTNLSELLKKYPFYYALKNKFPKMLFLANEIKIIPWEENFNLFDKNPEIIDTIEFLDILLKNNIITSEKYAEYLKNVSKGYASKTMGIAFINKKQVSFRSQSPHPDIVLHELGHIYFEVNDLLWNASYGGGETLFHLALKEKYTITEHHIRNYHSLLEQTFKNSEKIHKLITDTIAPKINVYPHLFTICLFAGYIPYFDTQLAYEFFNDLKSEKWSTIPVDQNHLFSFFQNLIDGLIYRDSTWVFFAKLIGIIET